MGASTPASFLLPTRVLVAMVFVSAFVLAGNTFLSLAPCFLAVSWFCTLVPGVAGTPPIALASASFLVPTGALVGVGALAQATVFVQTRALVPRVWTALASNTRPNFKHLKLMFHR